MRRSKRILAQKLFVVETKPNGSDESINHNVCAESHGADQSDSSTKDTVIDFLGILPEIIEVSSDESSSTNDESFRSTSRIEFMDVPSPSDSEEYKIKVEVASSDEDDEEQENESHATNSRRRKQAQPKKQKDRTTADILNYQSSTKRLIPRRPFQRYVCLVICNVIH